MYLKKTVSRKKYLYGLILLILAGIGGGLYYYQDLKAKGEEMPKYQEATVTRGDITASLTADGSAEIPVTNLGFEVAGTISEIMVEPGDTVKAGQILARLDDTDYLNSLSKAQQNQELDIINSQQTIRELKAQTDALETEYDVMLQIPDAYTPKEINDKKLAYEQALDSYDTQMRVLEITQASGATNVKAAQDALNNTVLKSPIESTVLAVEYSVGETIPENSTCIILQNNSNVEVNALISEVDINQIIVGQSVEAIFDAYEDRIFTGTVTFIGSIAETDSSGLVNYKVKVVLDGGQEIKHGMTCALEFIQKQVADVLMIPTKAVSVADGKQMVQVKDSKGTISKQAITTGFGDDNYVEVSEGLEEGQIVLVPITKAINQNSRENSGAMAPSPRM